VIGLPGVPDHFLEPREGDRIAVGQRRQRREDA
jgi:hypothetical protein